MLPFILFIVNKGDDTMDHWKQNRIKAAQQQQNPMVMARMRWLCGYR